MTIATRGADARSRHVRIRELKYRGAAAWPPQPPGGAFDPHHPAPATFELKRGTLRDVGIAPPNGGFPARVELRVERPDRKVETRALWAENAELVLNIYELLKASKGRSLEEIGELELAT
jgi:hypothetical protein